MAMSTEDLQNRVDQLRSEAKRLLNSAFGYNGDIASETVNQFVDCIISASMLQTALLEKQAMEASIKPVA